MVQRAGFELSEPLQEGNSWLQPHECASEEYCGYLKQGADCEEAEAANHLYAAFLFLFF